MKEENIELLRKVKYIPLGDKPAELTESKLFQDEYTFEVKLNIRMINISAKKISAVYVNLCGFDENVNLLFTKNIGFGDLAVQGSDSFSVETPVPSFKTTSVTITVNKVCFSDGTQWETGQEFIREGQEEIYEEESELFDDEFARDKKVLFSDRERKISEKRAQRLAEKELWKEKYSSPEEIKKRKIRKIIAWCVTAIIIISVSVGAFMAHTYIREQLSILENAIALYGESRYDEAEDMFDSIENLPAEKEDECRWYHALNCIKLENYSEALYQLSVLQGRHDSFTYMQQMNRLMSGIISAGEKHTVGLKKDGTVQSTGSNSFEQCNTDEWSDVIAVSAGNNHTIGLLDGGTVVATGDNEEKQCDVQEWNNIISVSAGGNHTTGVMNNGRVVATGDNEFGQCDVQKWSGIVAVSAGTSHTVGVKQDGTVVAVGNNELGQCDVGDWSDIVFVSAGNNFTLGIKSDGTVVATGDSVYNQTDVSELVDIVLCEAGDFHGLFLTCTGRMKYTGDNDWHQGEGGLWNNIISLSGGVYHSVGVSQDGTVYAAGENKNGQCQVSEWTDMGLPKDAFKVTSIE